VWLEWVCVSSTRHYLCAVGMLRLGM
jgi:hypothetical protein